MIFSLEILEKNNDECILILVIYWKKTGLLHTKISNQNIIYSSSENNHEDDFSGSDDDFLGFYDE